MNYAQLFYKLEKRNPQKAYWLDLCRRDNLSVFDLPAWAGVILIAFGIFISQISNLYPFVIGIGLGLFVVYIIGSVIVNENFRKKLEKEIKL